MFGEGVAGYYDPRSKRLRIVEGATPGPLAEIVLAHELNHALEDQRFGLAPDETATDDAALARVALVEGTAMLVMQEYVLRYVGADQAMARGCSGSAMSGQPDLPKFVQDQLIFPYLGGLQFATALQQQDGGGWATLDEAAAGARAREHRADPAPGEVPGAARSRRACGWTSGSAAAGGARPPGRGASGRPRSSSAATRAGVGRGPLRALAARRVRRRRRAAARTCW